MLEAVNEAGIVSIKLSCGMKLEGKLHPSLHASDAKDLVARVLDLESAYKQLPVASRSQWA
eukprot:10477268-Karenia_brevis.AAC.1